MINIELMERLGFCSSLILSGEGIALNKQPVYIKVVGFRRLDLTDRVIDGLLVRLCKC